jgi:sigma-E factor negative regulatory protein RseB
MTRGAETIPVFSRRYLPAWAWAWIGVLSVVLAGQGAHAGDAAESPALQVKGLLERMTQALRTLNYSGTFVYAHGDQLETLRIKHVVQGGQELEHLVSLNGAAREVRRDSSAVTCVMPEAKAVSVGHRSTTSDLWPASIPDLERLGGQYLLHPLGHFRVAERDATVVGIIPKDKYRYGYRFYLDDETGLPLKTDLMDEDARPIEQIMFTSLELQPDDMAPGLDVAADAEGFVTLQRDPPQRSAPDKARDWSFVELPAGFGLEVHNRWIGDEGLPVEHFVLSDGLASVSVYIEQEEGPGLQGGAHVGAVNAWGGWVADRQVTAVGEVPDRTVRRIVESLRFGLEDGGE